MMSYVHNIYIYNYIYYVHILLHMICNMYNILYLYIMI